MKNHLVRFMMSTVFIAFLSAATEPLAAHNMRWNEFRSESLDADCFGNDSIGNVWAGLILACPISEEQQAAALPLAAAQQDRLPKFRPLVNLSSTYTTLRMYCDSIFQTARSVRSPSRIAQVAGMQFGQWNNFWNSSDANTHSLAISRPDIGVPPSPSLTTQREPTFTYSWSFDYLVESVENCLADNGSIRDSIRDWQLDPVLTWWEALSSGAERPVDLEPVQPFYTSPAWVIYELSPGVQVVLTVDQARQWDIVEPYCETSEKAVGLKDRRIANCPVWTLVRDRITSQMVQQITFVATLARGWPLLWVAESNRSSVHRLATVATKWFEQIAETQIARAKLRSQDSHL